MAWLVRLSGLEQGRVPAFKRLPRNHTGQDDPAIIWVELPSTWGMKLLYRWLTSVLKTHIVEPTDSKSEMADSASFSPENITENNCLAKGLGSSANPS